MQREPKVTPGSAIGIIVKRAARVAARAGQEFRPTLVAFTLQHVHAHRPLRLTAMAKGPEFDLVHDVFGIIDNYDPTTRAFRNFWTPRYLVRQ